MKKRVPVQTKQASRPAEPVMAFSKKRLQLAYLIIGVLAALLYANTLGHDFTVDDGTVMQNNRIVKKGISAIPEIFTTRYREGFWDRKENMYRPLSLVMFAIEWQITGGKPWLGHLVNVVLHALLCVLLFHLFRKLLVRHHPFFPFVATLLFTVHPLHTEVVANIKSRDEILCLLFSLLGMLASLRYVQAGRAAWLMLSAGMVFMALLSKENAIAMVVIIPMLIWFFTDSKPRDLIWPSATMLIMAGVYFLIRISVLSGTGSQAELQLINNSLLATEGFSRFLMACYLMGKYLFMLLIPHPLSFDYSYKQISPEVAGSPLAWLSLAVICGFLIYALKGIRNKNPLSFSILFYFGTLALVSNVFFLIESTFAERFLFMPSVGFSLAAGLLLPKIFSSVRTQNSIFPLKAHPLWFALLIVILAGYSGKAISRNAKWKNNLTLLESDVKTCPESARIRYAYGSALLFEKAAIENDKEKKQRLIDEAIRQLEKGVGILGTYADAFYHLGIAYKEKGDFARAVHSFESAKRSKTWNEADFYIASGLAYGGMNRYTEAVAEFKKAIELKPQSYEAHNNAGMYLLEAGQADSALFYLDKSIALQNDYASAHYNRGNVFAKKGDFKTAIDCYARAIELDSLYEDAYNNTGNSYAAMREYEHALRFYLKAHEINPSNTKVINNIGVTYYMLGDTATAKKFIEMLKR